MSLFNEPPSRAAVASVQYLSYVFLVGAVAAAIAWMVFVAKWNINVYNHAAHGHLSYPLGAEDELATDRFTICYQAVVASTLMYFALRHMHHGLKM
jgi:hypothetical protein